MPVFRPKELKTQTVWTTHVFYIAYTREYPPPPGYGGLRRGVFFFFPPPAPPLSPIVPLMDDKSVDQPLFEQAALPILKVEKKFCIKKDMQTLPRESYFLILCLHCPIL